MSDSAADVDSSHRKVISATFLTALHCTALHCIAFCSCAVLPGLSVSDLHTCSLPHTSVVTFGSMSADISNLHSLRSACLLAFVQLAAVNPSVVRLGVMSRPQLTNYEARGVTQVRQLYLWLCSMS